MNSQTLIAYFHLHAETDLVCCDKNMLQKLDDNLKKASGIFGRCQSCMRNMQLSICALTCSPQQSRFMTPTIATYESEPSGNFFDSSFNASSGAFTNFARFFDRRG